MSSTAQSALFEPIKVGDVELKHRIVMAPLTRFRADKDTAIPSKMAKEYYTQRATDGGMIITEATFISRDAQGYQGIPGIYTAEQISAWKEINDAVHAKGGKMVLQLWHVGRAADPSYATLYAPSSIPIPKTDETFPNNDQIHVMTEEDIERTVEDYRKASINCIEAGFDAVEIHGAHGYLIDQFLQSMTNQRTDSYGGSIENRTRFPLMVLNAVCEAIGPEKVGLRMSPYNTWQGMKEEEPLDLFIPWTKAIVAAQPKLAYIHAVQPRVAGIHDVPLHLQKAQDTLDPIREIVRNANIKFLVAGGFKPDSALEHVKVKGQEEDVIVFGRYFISNPDLAMRIKNNWPLRNYDRSLFYAQGTTEDEGYISYLPHGETQVEEIKAM